MLLAPSVSPKALLLLVSSLLLSLSLLLLLLLSLSLSDAAFDRRGCRTGQHIHNVVLVGISKGNCEQSSRMTAQLPVQGCASAHANDTDLRAPACHVFLHYQLMHPLQTGKIQGNNRTQLPQQRTLRPPMLVEVRARRAGGRPLLLLTLPADAYSSSSSDSDTCKMHVRAYILDGASSKAGQN
jgi:hypothetical protein